MLFSIIIPSFNNDNLLTRCLNSMLDIDMEDIEIILVDDGSNKDQINFVPEVFKKQKNFKIIHQKNSGLSGARNIGIIQATGDYLVFLDGDDYFVENKFLLFYNEIKNIKYKPDLIKVGYYRKNDNQKIKEYNCKKSAYFNNLSNYILNVFFFNKLYAFASWTHIYNRKFWIKNNLFFKEKILAEDLEHLLRAYPKLNKIYLSKNSYCFYDNTNANSITKTKTNQIGKDIKSFLIPQNIKNNQLKVFLAICYYFSFKPKYKIKIKGFLLIIFKSPFILFKKN